MVDGEMHSEEFHEVALAVYQLFGTPMEEGYIDKIISEQK